MPIKTLEDGKEILKKHYDKQLELSKTNGNKYDVLWVQMKYTHSLDVYKVSEYLLKNDLALSKLDEKYKLYGKLGALLHDIGRAYEIGDKKLNGIRHGYFGAENILKDIEKEDNPFILLSFKYHDILDAENKTRNDLKESGLSQEEQEIVIKLLKLVMDSDKLANFKLFQNCNREYLLNLKGDLYITEKCFEDFKNKKLIDKNDRNTNLDQYLSYITWCYDLNFQASKDLVLKENYMGGIIKRMKDDILTLYPNSDKTAVDKVLRQIEEISQQLKNDKLL